jgi:hypothetical protein
LFHTKPFLQRHGEFVDVTRETGEGLVVPPHG